MRIVYLFPTIEEAKGFILERPKASVFVTGVGMAALAATMCRAVKSKRPHLVILAGVAGTYGEAPFKGEVVEVVDQCVVGLPERYREHYSMEPLTDLRPVKANTVDRCGAEAHGADIEEMEGAAFFSLCEALDVEGAEIRAISNRVGEERSAWCFDEAVENLTRWLLENDFEKEGDGEA